MHGATRLSGYWYINDDLPRTHVLQHAPTFCTPHNNENDDRANAHN